MASGGSSSGVPSHGGSLGFSRLQEEQEKSYAAVAQRIQQWEQFDNDYKNLHSFLGNVSGKLTYDVMVPFGKLAFMPGQLVNTNEVLVLLGDNWFVERSTREAQGIVERRIKACQDTLGKLEKEKDQTIEWMKHTQSELGDDDIKEIIEVYDPSRDLSWKEKRKQREGLTTKNSNDLEKDTTSKNGRIRWEDQEVSRPSVISFVHSDTAPTDCQSPQESHTVLSPGDILHMFGPPLETKSILKVPVAQQSMPHTEEKPQPLENMEEAFTGTIIEKSSPSQKLEPTLENRVSSKSDSEVKTGTSSRPTSRFKAQRSKN